jgi:16S rRNA (adenine1518-N6/adenine1519-N6)-dimethyltransferase
MSAQQSGIYLKKKFGQHFLRDEKVVEVMLDHVCLDDTTSVFEVGCGDGFLTKRILAYPIVRLWVFEIDVEWAAYVTALLNDTRLTIFCKNILDVDFSRFNNDGPWTLLSNLPYQIVFPFLHLMQKQRQLLKEGVIMVQEEVAQKIVATRGRGYGYPALFFQHYFDWKLLIKISPSAFYPPPKVDSRLLYFKPKQPIVPIPDEKDFWQFVKLLFKQPRRTLRNNLKQTRYSAKYFDESTLSLRAQQLSMVDILNIWTILCDFEKSSN